MVRLSQRAVAKISGPAWESLRGQFMNAARLLLAVSPVAHSELLTIYIKFTTDSDPQSPTYAAIWLKSSQRLIVGLSLPESCTAAELGPPPPGTVYRGLTKYFVVERGGTVPKALAQWARLAYEHAQASQPWAAVAGTAVQSVAAETKRRDLAAERFAGQDSRLEA